MPPLVAEVRPLMVGNRPPGFGAPTKDEELKSLFADEDAWAEATAAKVWKEAQQGIATD